MASFGAVEQAIRTIKETLELAKEDGELTTFHSKVLTMKIEYFERDFKTWWEGI